MSRSSSETYMAAVRLRNSVFSIAEQVPRKQMNFLLLQSAPGKETIYHAYKRWDRKMDAGSKNQTSNKQYRADKRGKQPNDADRHYDQHRGQQSCFLFLLRALGIFSWKSSFRQ